MAIKLEGGTALMAWPLMEELFCGFPSQSVNYTYRALASILRGDAIGFGPAKKFVFHFFKDPGPPRFLWIKGSYLV